MGRGVVGIELASDRVRAVELGGWPRRAQVVQVGEAELAPRVVDDGEIADVEAVGRALRELWAKSKFSSRRVVLGLANRSVAIRTSEMPTMALDDMRNALAFEMGELIPFPLDDAVVDLAVVDTVALSTGGSRSRLLVVAARRTMVETAVRACKLARLDVVAIDPASLGLVRSVYLDGGMDRLAGTVLIGEIGTEGLAHVSVAIQGKPVLGRTLNYVAAESTPTGELEAELALIEQYRRRAATENGAPIGPNERPGRQRNDPLIDALRTSYDYFQTQPGAPRVERVLLLGPHERTSRIAPDLAALLGLAVEPISLLADREVRKDKGATVDRHGAALGVAARATKMPVGFALNLLPAKMLKQQASRRLGATSAAAALLTASAFGGLTVVRGQDATTATTTATDAEIQTLQKQVAALSEPISRRRQLTELRSIRTTLLNNEVDWPSLIGAALAAAPSDTSLRSVSVSTPSATTGNPATPSAPAGGAATSAPANTPGAPAGGPAAAPAGSKSTPRTALGTDIVELRFQIRGRGLASVGQWLQALSGIKGFQQPWLESSSTDTSGNTDFTVTVGVAPAGRTARSQAIETAATASSPPASAPATPPRPGTPSSTAGGS